MKVVVIGGGVAGTASAIALRRIGADVIVYEAYTDPAGPVGSFVSLAANGLRVLDVLGCLEPVQRAGFAVPRQKMWSSSGKLLANVARGRQDSDPLYSVTLMRGDLVTILRKEAGRLGVQIVTGQRINENTMAGDDFAQADLLVGADGMWSVTRQLVDPGSSVPVYAGTYTVSGMSSGLHLEPGSFNMILARRGAFLYVTAPDDTVWWSAQVAASTASDPRVMRLDGVRALFSTEQQATTILNAVHRLHGMTLNHVLPALPPSHNERIVLIGDAAHPVGAGQGVSMAIEDAVALAQQLHCEPTISTALACFEQVRRPRVDKMARVAITNRDAKVAGPLTARMRNLVMPIMFPRIYPRATNWLYSYDPGTLPDPVAVQSAIDY